MGDKKSKLEIILRLTGKIVVILLAVSGLLFFLYIIGNFQHFMDMTQSLILSIMNAVLLIGFLFSLYYLILILVLTVIRKKALLLRLTSTLAILVYFILVFLGVKFLNAILH